jgi:hypothetical protein
MMKKRPLLLGSLILGSLLIMLSNLLTTGCVKVTYTCVSCHTDKDTLIDVADAIEYPPSTGEG